MMIFNKKKHTNNAIETHATENITLNQKELTHLTIVLCEQEVCKMDKIEELVFQWTKWCLFTVHSKNQLNISCVSLYDVNGILRSHLTDIIYCLKKRREELGGMELDEERTNLNTCTIVFNNGKCVRLLDYENCGRPLTTRLSYHIIEKARRQDRWIQPLDEYVAHELKIQKDLTFTDSELLLVFSPICNLHGYSPIHLRYAQIIHSDEPASQLTYNKLVHHLMRYAQCEQRYGA
jgi:hypothetical protein